MKPKTDYSAEDAQTTKRAEENKAKRAMTEKLIQSIMVSPIALARLKGPDK